MLRNLLVIFNLFVVLSASGQLKPPDYFINKIPAFPTTTAQQKQVRNLLDVLIREAAAEVKSYAEATEDMMPYEAEPEVTTRRFTMKNAAIAQRNAQNAKNEVVQAEETLEKFDKYKTDFEKLQMEYKKEVLEKLIPLDVKIIKMQRDVASKNSLELSRALKERTALYQVLQSKYLSGTVAKFPALLTEFFAFTKNTFIPLINKKEAAEYASLKLPFTPYRGSIDALRIFMVCQQRAADNYNDFKD